MKRVFFFLMITLFMQTVCSQGSGRRLALVIGNGEYTQGNELKNPVNDAGLMAATLKNCGFEVMKYTNATLKTMQMATIDFTNKIKDYDVALFYYAGHGIEVDGENYLIPVDAAMETKAHAQFEAFNIDYINNAFIENRNHLNIMVLDACRDNPFRTWMRGGSRGFKAISNQTAGTLIAFATREGETASDGTGSNGLYTQKLVEQINKGQSMHNVFRNTRIEVLKASNNEQCPQEWDMTTGEFYFTPVRTNEQEKINATKNILPRKT